MSRTHRALESPSARRQLGLIIHLADRPSIFQSLRRRVRAFLIRSGTGCDFRFARLGDKADGDRMFRHGSAVGREDLSAHQVSPLHPRVYARIGQVRCPSLDRHRVCRSLSLGLAFV